MTMIKVDTDTTMNTSEGSEENGICNDNNASRLLTKCTYDTHSSSTTLTASSENIGLLNSQQIQNRTDIPEYVSFVPPISPMEGIVEACIDEDVDICFTEVSETGIDSADISQHSNHHESEFPQKNESKLGTPTCGLKQNFEAIVKLESHLISTLEVASRNKWESEFHAWKTFTKFRFQYLAIHAAIMLADGLQGKLVEILAF